jgi:hypothetical protein
MPGKGGMTFLARFPRGCPDATVGPGMRSGAQVAGRGLREQVREAHRDGDTGTERALEGAWQLRLQRLLRAGPDLAT